MINSLKKLEKFKSRLQNLRIKKWGFFSCPWMQDCFSKKMNVPLPTVLLYPQLSWNFFLSFYHRSVYLEYIHCRPGLKYGRASKWFKKYALNFLFWRNSLNLTGKIKKKIKGIMKWKDGFESLLNIMKKWKLWNIIAMDMDEPAAIV